MAGKWITPLMKQSFVTAGVSLNVAAGAIVIGFATGLMEQLKAPGSTLPTDASSMSWIAAMPIFTMFVGNIIVIPVMEKYGRRSANLISIVVDIIAWICVIFSSSVALLLFARALQGIHVGMSVTLGSLLIGEYTTPKYRGSFLMSISILIATAYLTVHSVGSYVQWQSGAIIWAAISILNLIIVILSPESPSWLACQGRYEHSKRVFRWLRGDDEEEELRKLIEANVIVEELKAKVKVVEPFYMKIQKSLTYFRAVLMKREFYVPLIIMLHIYSIASFGGMYILTVYSSDLFHTIVGSDANLPLLIITVDFQRIITNIFGIYIIQRTKRRTMLFTTIGIQIMVLLVMASYSYARECNALPFDHPMIAIILTHCLMFAIAVGTLPLTYTIAGEVFPLEFKNLAGGLSNLTYSAFSFLSVKTIPYCFISLGIHGTFCLYVIILSYGLFVIWLLLPETKGRTLQDIEEELRGKPVSALDVKSVMSLTSFEDRD